MNSNLKMFLDFGEKRQYGGTLAIVLICALATAFHGVFSAQGLFFVSPFVHASWTHFSQNMFLFYVFGRLLEPVIGSSRFVFFFVLYSYVSCLLAGYFTGHLVMGISGGIMGLSSHLVFLMLGSNLWALVEAFVLMAFAFGSAWDDAMSLSRNDVISHSAHLIGFAQGLVVGFLMWRRNIRH